MKINIQHQITRPLKPTAPSLQIKLQTSQPEQILSHVTPSASTTSSTTPTSSSTTISTASTTEPPLMLPPNVQIPYTTGDATAYQQLITPSILPVQDQPSRKVISSHELQSNKKTTERMSPEFKFNSISKMKVFPMVKSIDIRFVIPQKYYKNFQNSKIIIVASHQINCL